MGDIMAYHICYQPGKQKFRAVKSSLRFSTILVLCFILFFYLVGTFWPEGTEFLRRTFLDPNAFNIIAALNDFTEKLRCTEAPLSVFAEFYGKMLP